MTRVIGWDLGGANIKLACVQDVVVAGVWQVPCPIVPDRAKFDAAVEAAGKHVPPGAVHAVTMPGELSDVFTDRSDGVAYLVGLMQRATAGASLLVYAGRAGFLAPEDGKGRVAEVASANWHAT